MSSMSFAPLSHGFGESSSSAGAADDDDSSLSLTAQLQRIFALAASPPPASLPPSESASASSSSSSAVAPPPDPALQLLRHITDAQQLAASLELISANDRLADLGVGTLRALLLPAVLGEVLGRVRTPVGQHAARMELLRKSRDAWRRFLLSLLQLGVLPAPSPSAVGLGLLTSQARAQLSAAGSPKLEPANRRALKIALLQLERAITRALDAHREAAREKARARLGGGLRAQREGVERGAGAAAALEMPHEAQWDLLVLPRVARGMVNSGGGGGESDESSDEEAEDAPGGLPSAAGGAGGNEAVQVGVPRSTRAYVLLLLALHASKALSALDSCAAELELLQNMPAATAAGRAEGSRERTRDGEDAQAWRLDRRLDAGAPGALLDAKGKVLRPFQITGSSSSSSSAQQRNPMGTLADDGMNKRQELRAQVFQPGHRLPTMSIDEFLDEEERRGNIITGGGPEGAARATPREARALRMENDGTREADEAEEEARQEAIQWDTFREHNRRGEGNTMNRG